MGAGTREIIIRLEDVHKGFGSGERRVVPMAGVSLSVERGSRLVVIGPSGTGKSVMLRLILGLLEPDRGNIVVFGRSIPSLGNYELGEVRKRIAMLFQGGALFDSMTVGENVAFPMRAMGEKDEGKIAEIVGERLRQVGLPGTEDKMPAELSGGMRKRAALARSLACRPEVILYDEPTTGLDPITSDAIADLINATHRSLAGAGVTSIIVTHDMRVAGKTADRILMLYGGRIVGDGPPELYARLGESDGRGAASETEMMIRQFVRGEAEGPIHTVA
jgi:phospholipid/cholesterol/gamma-HCH transport system ATP-binding protein